MIPHDDSDGIPIIVLNKTNLELQLNRPLN